MSHGPSTLGSMMTSSLSPTAPTISTTSSSAQGEFNALIRVHRPVAPKSFAFAMSMKPARAAFLASAGIASSRLPSTTSTCAISSGTFARSFSICGGTKWIMRSSLTGNSRSGAGAPEMTTPTPSRRARPRKACRRRDPRRHTAGVSDGEHRCHGSPWIHTGEGVAVVVSSNSSPSRIALSCKLVAASSRSWPTRDRCHVAPRPRRLRLDSRGRRSMATAGRPVSPSVVRDRRCVARAEPKAGTTDQASHHPPLTPAH